MADTLTQAQRQQCMRAVTGKNTAPEIAVRKICRELGYRYRTQRKDLPGTPDFVFSDYTSVVLVHGCYWHCHRCKRGRSTPTTNADFWRMKRKENRLRDRRVVRALRRLGWRVLVVWECQTKDRQRLAARLAAFLSRKPTKPTRLKGSIEHRPRRAPH